MSSLRCQLLRERVWCTEPRVYWISVALLAATIGVFASGIPCTIPLYAGFLKSFFNSTHSQVSFITGAYVIGGGFHVPAAIFESRLGPRWTMLAACVFTSFGFILLYLSFVLSSLRKISFLFIGLFFFLTSNGRTYTYMSAFSCAIWNTPTPHRAKILSFLDMVFELAALMQIVCFYNLFHGNGMQATDIANFTLFSLCMCAVCHVICGPFLVKTKVSRPDESVEKENPNHEVEDFAVLTSNTTRRLQRLNKSSTFKFLFSFEFLLLNFSMSLSIALSYAFFYNTAHFTHSLHLSSFNQTIMTVFTAGVISTKILAGITLDRYRGSKMIYVIILAVFIQSSMGQVLSLVSLYLSGDVQIAFLIIGYFTSGITVGAVCLFTPILLSDICGLPKIARNVAIVYSCSTILNLMIQVIYGELYDSMNRTPSVFLNGTLWDKAEFQFVMYNDSADWYRPTVNDHNMSYRHNDTTQPLVLNQLYCKGIYCVQPTLLLTTCLSLVALVMFILLTLRLYDRLGCDGPSKHQHPNQNAIQSAQGNVGLEKIIYDPVPPKDTEDIETM